MRVENLKSGNKDESCICWICRGEFSTPFPEEGDNFVVDCCNCGDYKISKSLRASQFPMADTERCRFSFWGKQQQLEKREPPLLNSYTIDAITARLPKPTASEKPDILLRSLSLLHTEPGKTFTMDRFRESTDYVVCVAPPENAVRTNDRAHRMAIDVWPRPWPQSLGACIPVDEFPCPRAP
jgi:hypothetical protein